MWVVVTGLASDRQQYVQRRGKRRRTSHPTASSASVRSLEQQGRILPGIQRDSRRHTGRDGATGGLRFKGIHTHTVNPLTPTELPYGYRLML